ncbi:MAG: DUF4190 domain-containing protein [Treponema sp.]|nr:DUF4190 domain-containing protein [Treponema sp.]
MNTNLLAIVNRIVAEQGEGILADAKRLFPYFADYAKNEAKEDRVAFGRCLEMGAYQELKKTRTVDERQRVKATLINQMNAKTGIDRPHCNEALDLLEAVMFRPVQQSYQPSSQAGAPVNVQVNTSVYTPVNAQKTSSLGTAALVCGILGLCGGAIPVVQYFTFILSILGIVFGASARKKAKYAGQPTGMATAGMVLGIIAVIVTIIAVLFIGAFYYWLFSEW